MKKSTSVREVKNLKRRKLKRRPVERVEREQTTVQAVVCGLCNQPLRQGESRQDHIDKYHQDIFTVRTYFVGKGKLP